MSETTVVNFRRDQYDVKITRRPDNTIPDPPKFGFLGNPFSVAQYGRERCIELFEEYFLDRLETDTNFAEAVLVLKGKRLGCVCKPQDGFCGKLLCHGQIIAAWLDDVQPTDIL